MRSGLALPWVLAAACGFDGPKLAGDAGGPDGCASFSAQLDTCQLTNPFSLMLSGALTFDTDMGVLRDASNAMITVHSELIMTRGAEVRALIATRAVLRPDTRLRARGTRGFAIVATEAITLMTNALIDVGDGGAGRRGDCGPDGAAVGMDDGNADGAGGGGGGGFGASGGEGGAGDAGPNPSTGGASGKIASPLPEGPLGGCPGARGGKGDNESNDGGAGGAGGGAVYLVSAESIAIDIGAGIDAGGGGGGGGERDSSNGDAGGGGGGSGGSIFLEAPTIRNLGILAANGGAGGEGSGGGAAGQPGARGPLGIAQAAGGQSGSTSGADGGAGGHFMSPEGAKPAQHLAGGGGGGGGSVGVIHIGSVDAELGTMVSPAPR